jgi:hypothetical protein
MPIVAIDLSPEEAARFDAVADREKRARKAQVHISALRGLESAEAEFQIFPVAAVETNALLNSHPTE